MKASIRQINVDGIRSLWAAVLLQIIRDATLAEPSDKAERAAKRKAIAWLNAGGRDFAVVCAFSGVDPSAVRELWKRGRITRESFLRASPNGRYGTRAKGNSDEVAG